MCCNGLVYGALRRCIVPYCHKSIQCCLASQLISRTGFPHSCSMRTLLTPVLLHLAANSPLLLTPLGSPRLRSHRQNQLFINSNNNTPAWRRTLSPIPSQTRPHRYRHRHRHRSASPRDLSRSPLLYYTMNFFGKKRTSAPAPTRNGTAPGDPTTTIVHEWA